MIELTKTLFYHANKELQITVSTQFFSFFTILNRYLEIYRLNDIKIGFSYFFISILFKYIKTHQIGLNKTGFNNQSK